MNFHYWDKVKVKSWDEFYIWLEWTLIRTYIHYEYWLSYLVKFWLTNSDADEIYFPENQLELIK